MPTLHTVNKSPFEKNALSSCVDHASDGDAILLIEDGVYGALEGTSCGKKLGSKSGPVSLYVLGPDLQARGLGKSKLVGGVSVVDYEGFVDLVTQHDVTQSWL